MGGNDEKLENRKIKYKEKSKLRINFMPSMSEMQMKIQKNDSKKTKKSKKQQIGSENSAIT